MGNLVDAYRRRATVDRQTRRVILRARKGPNPRMHPPTLAACVLTFDTGAAVLRPVKARERFDRTGITTDVTGTFSYQDEIRLTPARVRAIRALLRKRT